MEKREKGRSSDGILILSEHLFIRTTPHSLKKTLISDHIKAEKLIEFMWALKIVPTPCDHRVLSSDPWLAHDYCRAEST